MKNAARIIGLAATLVCSSALQAQDCSGGAAGGTDATGNQCNAVSESVAYLMPSAATSPQPTARISAVALAPAVRAAPTDRFRNVASTAVATVRTSKIQTGSESMCSGGVDGGMDATGNQCNAPVPGNANDQAVLASAR